MRLAHHHAFGRGRRLRVVNKEGVAVRRREGTVPEWGLSHQSSALPAAVNGTVPCGDSPSGLSHQPSAVPAAVNGTVPSRRLTATLSWLHLSCAPGFVQLCVDTARGL